MKHLVLFVLVTLASVSLTARAVPDTGPTAAAPASVVPFDTHDGYFVSNKFEPDVAASFVVAPDRKVFDDVFGVAFVMKDKHHRLPAAAFESKMVIASIKRGKAVWTYKVDAVTADAGVLTLRYAATSEPHPTAEFACPLIVSVPKGDYTAVLFVEDGKVVKKVKLESGKVRNAAELPFGIRCRKKDDVIRISTEPGRTVFNVTSPSGIGGAVVERNADLWPDELILRIHLSGLESLSVVAGDTTLRASVSSHGDNARLLQLAKGGKEGPQLTKDDPYWTEIQALDAKGKPVNGMPGAGGWFEMAIPKALLVDSTKSLVLEWIDFYRN